MAKKRWVTIMEASEELSVNRNIFKTLFTTVRFPRSIFLLKAENMRGGEWISTHSWPPDVPPSPSTLPEGNPNERNPTSVPREETCRNHRTR